jgi:hypothetical protein
MLRRFRMQFLRVSTAVTCGLVLFMFTNVFGFSLPGELVGLPEESSIFLTFLVCLLAGILLFFIWEDVSTWRRLSEHIEEGLYGIMTRDYYCREDLAAALAAHICTYDRRYRPRMWSYILRKYRVITPTLPVLSVLPDSVHEVVRPVEEWVSRKNPSSLALGRRLDSLCSTLEPDFLPLFVDRCLDLAPYWRKDLKSRLFVSKYGALQECHPQATEMLLAALQAPNLEAGERSAAIGRILENHFKEHGQLRAFYSTLCRVTQLIHFRDRPEQWDEQHARSSLGLPH